jgi:hypothetical protein
VKVVDVPQVGPGQYQTVVALMRKGPYLFRGAGSAAGAASQLLPAVYPAEYHFDAPDIAKLQVISAETGGVFEPKPSDIAESHGETVPAPVPLWPYCVAAALMLYIGDVFVRRMWRS